MSDIFQLTTRPAEDLFFKRNDKNDPRLGEIISSYPADYEKSEVVILGCPQDEGVRRNKGRVGAAKAPDAIRAQFYKLTDFGIEAKIFDLGNTIIRETLEETHDAQTEIVRRLIRDGKKIISLGGGNDVSYPDCKALTLEFEGRILAFNIDAHFDVRDDQPRNSGTPYRQLLEEKLILPHNFYEMAYQPQSCSSIHFDYLQKLGVKCLSLNKMRAMTPSFTGESYVTVASAISPVPTAYFFGFDVDSVRASDAPGVSAPSPIGLTAEEFCQLAESAGRNTDTQIIEFTEVNPDFDIDNRTSRLVAIAMHRFCSAMSERL